MDQLMKDFHSCRVTMPTKVFIGNLSPDVSNEELRDLFQPFGPLVEYDVLSGFGFVVSATVSDLLSVYLTTWAFSLCTQVLNFQILELGVYICHATVFPCYNVAHYTAVCDTYNAVVSCPSTVIMANR